MDKYNTIFIHIPKAAGTSVIRALAGRRVPRDHASWNHFLQVDRRRFAAYYKFTFVRNPWDRTVSVYNYLAHGGNQGADKWYAQFFEKEKITFESFVMDYLDEYRIHEHILLRPQYLFVCDDKLDIQADFVGKYEALEADFAKVCRQLGVDLRLTKENPSGDDRNYQQWFRDDALRQRIAKLYRRDIELFNYGF